MDPNMKVLVVDDFATMRKVIRNMLQKLGCEKVFEAENGEEAFRIAKGDDFDLIVSDWNMPVMTGLEFLRAVRSEEKTKNIPFLMVTAEANKENILLFPSLEKGGTFEEPIRCRKRLGGLLRYYHREAA